MKTALNVLLGSVALLAPILGFSVFRAGAQGRREESVRFWEPYDEPKAGVTAKMATPPLRRQVDLSPIGKATGVG
jgi:hypothetical protein